MKKVTLIFTIINTILLLGIVIYLFTVVFNPLTTSSPEEQVEEAYKKALEAAQ